MRNVIWEINKQINKFENVLISKKSNATDIEISKYFISKWKKREKLVNIDQLANEINISKSSISKFIKKNSIPHFQVLKYLYNLNLHTYDEEQYNDWGINLDKNIDLVVKKLRDKKRILLVGTGNSGLLAKSFYTRLILAEINAIFLEGKPDQIYMINKMNMDDLIVCFSFSLSHEWTKRLINNEKDKIIFTGQDLKSKKNMIVFTNHYSRSFKYNNIDLGTLNFINEQIEKIIKKIKKVSEI